MKSQKVILQAVSPKVERQLANLKECGVHPYALMTRDTRKVDMYPPRADRAFGDTVKHKGERRKYLSAFRLQISAHNRSIAFDRGSEEKTSNLSEND